MDKSAPLWFPRLITWLRVERREIKRDSGGGAIEAEAVSSVAQPLWRDAAAGLALATVMLAYALSFGALIFSGPIAPWAEVGVAAAMLGSAFANLTMARFSSVKTALAGPDTPVVAVVTALAIGVTGQMHAGAGAHAQLSTVIVAIGLKRIAGWVRFIPYPVVSDFMAASGRLLILGRLSAGGWSRAVRRVPRGPGVERRVRESAGRRVGGGVDDRRPAGGGGCDRRSLPGAGAFGRRDRRGLLGRLQPDQDPALPAQARRPALPDRRGRRAAQDAGRDAGDEGRGAQAAPRPKPPSAGARVEVVRGRTDPPKRSRQNRQLVAGRLADARVERPALRRMSGAKSGAPAGAQPLRLRTMLGRTVIGEIGFYKGVARSASVYADQDSEVFALDRKTFERLHVDEPQVATALHTMIVRLLGGRLMFANREIAALQ